MTTLDLLSVGLPKWPQMVATGSPVTVEQAKEIIRRTDRFFESPEYAGNNEHHRARLMKLFGIPTAARDADTDTRIKVYDRQRRWRDRWDYVGTAYVHNDWIACSYIGGPYGWCHLDGTIGFAENVGKWPSVDSIQHDWQVLLDAFPFLNIGVTLMDREQCEEGGRPLVSMAVGNGQVLLLDPAEANVHEGHQLSKPIDSMSFMTRRFAVFGGVGLECAVPDDWFQEWGERFKREQYRAARATMLQLIESGEPFGELGPYPVGIALEPEQQQWRQSVLDALEGYDE
jgi:hypothetical protein